MNCSRLAKLAADLIPGGKGRDKPDSDFDPKQLELAEQIEKEHFLGAGIPPKKMKRLTREIGKDHLTENDKYYNQNVFQKELKKEGGGPGSGVSGDNTLPIEGMRLSKLVSVGTRKSLLDNMPYYEDEVPMSKITAVSQEKYVPAKLERMLKDSKGVLSKHIDLLRIPEDDEYHVIDGHHRFLVAKKMGAKTLKARVYERRVKD